MPATHLRLLSRKGSRRKPDLPRALKPAKRLSRQEMIATRDRYMAELKLFRNGIAANGFFEKALQLLTRHWAVASWTARLKILNTAEWLIQAGAQTPDLNQRVPLQAAE